jgi:hypothetical protein
MIKVRSDLYNDTGNAKLLAYDRQPALSREELSKDRIEKSPFGKKA